MAAILAYQGAEEEPIMNPALPSESLPESTREELLWRADGIMRAHLLVLRTRAMTRARTPEEFYGFRAEDVECLHFRKRRFGAGIWFRLKDGRVVDSLGRPSQRWRAWYDCAT
jgi:hypothetical protein